MIERWFPCAEVSAQSQSGWGSGNQEAAMFSWFAKRPIAQARAAMLTSLLPWPEDPVEQRRLQDLVRKAMSGSTLPNAQLRAEIEKANTGGASTLDPFSGRAMLPLEAARLGIRAHGVDYSPVATLAGQLLADFPLRDWSHEPELRFPDDDEQSSLLAGRLYEDVRKVVDEIGRRYRVAMAPVYPEHDERLPWGYLWASTLPCQECERRFPLTGSLVLRHAKPAKGDLGQSYRIETDARSGSFRAVVHDGPPEGRPTVVALTKGDKAVRGKAVICPFCDHVHTKATHTRLMAEGLGRDALLLAADLDPYVSKLFRACTNEEIAAVDEAGRLLAAEPDFGPGLPAVPHERIPAGNNDTVRASMYGARTYGELCNARQTLGFVRLSRTISDLGTELRERHGLSERYAAALTGYASSVLVRKMRRSTRGAPLIIYKDGRPTGVGSVFLNEASLAFSYDYFETGLGEGAGSWASIRERTLAALKTQTSGAGGVPADITRGTASALPFRTGSVSAVVCDPPYDDMIDYSDASDLFYVWLKRCLHTTAPWFAFTSHPDGVQEKADEAIVKRGGKAVNDHRTVAHYDDMIARSFAEARRVVHDDGVVTIVFGHGDPEVWHRLLSAITKGGLVLTGSWPAKTESKGAGTGGSANIVTTLTMACRPAPADRPDGRANRVEAEVRREVRSRIPVWDAAGLAPTDQLMASAGPAMETVGRYSSVLDHLGEPVDPAQFLVIARKAVVDATSLPIDHLPIDTFDARTRFALGWARLYRRGAAAKSEARWQALAADLTVDDLKGILSEADKGVRLASAREWKGAVTPTSSVIDVAMAMAKAWPNGLDDVAQVLVAAERDAGDVHLWATLGYLSSLLPEADPDAVAWTSLVRARRGIGNVARGVLSAQREADQNMDRQGDLFDLTAAGGTEMDEVRA